MDTVVKNPSIDVSGWESVVIHLSEGAYGDVTASNIRELINKDIAKTAKQKNQPAIETQEQYDNKYIKALFNRMEEYLDSITVGTQEVQCVIDGANSNFSAYIGLFVAQGNLNNLEDLDKLLRDGMGENDLRKLLEDIVTSFTESGSRGYANQTIFEITLVGIEETIDDMRSDRLLMCYDEWDGGEDCHMGRDWWQPYTERILKMAMVLHKIMLDYLNKYPNFDSDDLEAKIDSNDLTFNIIFEYDESIGDIIRTKADFDDFLETYAKKYG